MTRIRSILKQIRRVSILPLLCIAHFNGMAQVKPAKPQLNLDFEKVKNGRPIGWGITSNSQYAGQLDSGIVQHGKYSVSLTHLDGEGGFGNIGITIPYSYPGKKITLSGYLKTENVSDGFAGLWMRIDPKVAFDNMNKQQIKGTQDWTKYEITLDLDPTKTKAIVFGGILIGKGKMWIDNLNIQIDGKDIATLEPIAPARIPAEEDHEFDQGSNIGTFELDQNKQKALKDLGLIWGFLKYYHPQIAAGNYNWDYALFRVLPKILAAHNQQQRDQVLTAWIRSLGTYDTQTDTQEEHREIKLRPDLSWISSSGFSATLQLELQKVRKAKRNGSNYYIELASGIGNPVINNENPYAGMDMKDPGYRILSLYRYWNLIQYYFPYKEQIGKDWKTVLDEFIPKMVAADNTKAYTLTTLELIGNIHDTHANIWSKNKIIDEFRGERIAACYADFIQDKAVITGFHDKERGNIAGLKVGDILTSINGNPIESIVAEQLKYYPASNLPTQRRDIANNLLRSNDSTLQLTIQDGKKVYNRSVPTYPMDKMPLYSKYRNTDTCFKMLDRNIAYFNNGNAKRNYLSDLVEHVKNTKGLIIDCRNYPSEFIVHDVCSYLLPRATTFTKITVGDISTPGLFYTLVDQKTGNTNPDYYKGKVVILVNEITQSSAEFHAMAYSTHPNALVIGSTTAAADGNVSPFFLPGGIRTMFSGIGIYYPNGDDTQRVGVKLDVDVSPTIDGIKAGKDEVLEKAIALIRQP